MAWEEEVRVLVDALAVTAPVASHGSCGTRRYDGEQADGLLSALAASEVMQGAVVPAVVTESATPTAIGRYTSAYQVTFSIADIICPTVVTMALHAGVAALWLPLSAVALLDLAAVALLARRMPALTHRVGQSPPAPVSPADRPLEAEDA